LRPLAKEIGDIAGNSEGRAMTYATFRESHVSKNLDPQREGALRRALSGLYINHYIKQFRALTVTQIPGLEYFEKEHSEPLLGLEFLRFMCEFTGLHGYLESKEKYGRTERILQYYSTEKQELHFATNRLSVVVLHMNCGDRCRKLNWNEMPALTNLLALEGRNLPDVQTSLSYRDTLCLASQRINALCNILARRNVRAKTALEAVDAQLCRLLIATATDTEDRVLLKVFGAHGMQIVSTDFDARNSIRYFGIHGGVEIFHVRSSAGGAGPSGSQEVVGEAMERVRPHFVISAGICAGLVPSKQKLGDIAVSTALRDYESQRVGEQSWWNPVALFKIIARGSRPDAGPLLIDRARHCQLRWSGANIHYGVYLSGSKLVDNRLFKNIVLEIEPEAVALEMEGLESPL
jgi:nucleoside phosphorylase